MSGKPANFDPFEHIAMPKVLHHRVCNVTQNIKALGLTIGFETRAEGLSWNKEGFIEFLDEHLLSYCFTPDENRFIPISQVPKKFKEAYEFLRKYCDRWKKGKIANEPDYRPIQGVLGEWFLHAFSTKFFATKSLYSKVYLHQGRTAVHGFDIVHYKEDSNYLGFSLWLGEAKFHETLSNAINSALKSLYKACGYEYLKSQEIEEGTKGEMAFISRYATTGKHGENQSVVNKIIEYLGRNKQISVDDFLKNITIPVLLVVSDAGTSEISTMDYKLTESLLIKSAIDADVMFFKKLSEEFPGLQSIDIRVIVLPLGNYKNLVEHFENMVMGAVEKNAF